MAGTAAAAPPDYDRSDTHKQVLLRATPSSLERLLAQYDLTLLQGSGDSGHPLLVAGPEGLPAEQLAELLLEDAAVTAAEAATLTALPRLGPAGAPDVHRADIVPDLLQTGQGADSCWGDQSEEPWSGFSSQSTADLIRLSAAHQSRLGCGRGVTVAVLDTGLDSDHPLLAEFLVAGYDFLFEEPGLPSEYRLMPNQSMTTIVEQSMTTIVEADRTAVLAGRGEAAELSDGIAPILASSSFDDLEEMSLPPFFGHGTMVAGLVRWTAPQASIMPLRVFDGNGNGHIYDVVRAIYWAVDHGANIINMSFTVSGRSAELREAVRYARDRGVVAIAAVGNQGERSKTYPASYPEVAGTAATTLEDELAEFSNRGPQLAALAAPGAGVISTYPGNHYAAGWGTSFATPLASGTLALVFNSVQGHDRAAAQERVRLLTEGSQQLDGLSGEVKSGRLDAYGTILLSDSP